MLQLKPIVIILITCITQVLIGMNKGTAAKNILSLPQNAVRHIADYCSPLDQCHIGKTCTTLRGYLADTRAQDLVDARPAIRENRNDLSRRLWQSFQDTDRSSACLCKKIEKSGAILGGIASTVATGFLAFLTKPFKAQLPILTPVIVAAPLAGYIASYALSFPIRLLPLYLAIRRFKNANQSLIEKCYYGSKHEAFYDLKDGWEEDFWPRATRYRKENEQEIPFMARKCMNLYYDFCYVSWIFRCWAIKRFVKKMLFSELPER